MTCKFLTALAIDPLFQSKRKVVALFLLERVLGEAMREVCSRQKKDLDRSQMTCKFLTALAIDPISIKKSEVVALFLLEHVLGEAMREVCSRQKSEVSAGRGWQPTAPRTQQNGSPRAVFSYS